MAKKWIDQPKIRELLAGFFNEQHDSVLQFGNTVNQTFEAFVFASVVGWYQRNGWSVAFRNPKKAKDDPAPGEVRLKFSTNGRPGNYSYVECRKNDTVIEVRHQLRVATSWHETGDNPRANVCLDVAVLQQTEISDFDTRDHLDNGRLITFGEAKHMSAFAELVAGFEGLVHELQPSRLSNIRAGAAGSSEHPAPFLYVSGTLNETAEGIFKTIRRRGYDVDIYTRTDTLLEAFKLPTVDPPKAIKKRPSAKRAKISPADIPF